MGIKVITAVRLDHKGRVDKVLWQPADGGRNEFTAPAVEADRLDVVDAITAKDEVFAQHEPEPGRRVVYPVAVTADKDGNEWLEVVGAGEQGRPPLSHWPKF